LSRPARSVVFFGGAVGQCACQRITGRLKNPSTHSWPDFESILRRLRSVRDRDQIAGLIEGADGVLAEAATDG